MVRCFFRAEEVALARAQRKLSKARHAASSEREKKRKVVARVHERIGNRRKNFIEQEVCKLIKRFGRLSVEALVVWNMVQNPKIAKSIADASWSKFFAHLLCKEEGLKAVGRHSRVIPEAPGLEPWGVVT